VVVFARQELAFETPLDLTDRTFDHVRVPCERAAGAESVRVLARERSGRVHAYASRPDENALHDSVIATDVRAFDALATPSGLLVAYAGVAEGAQVRVVQVDSRGNARGAAAVPAACFSPAGGLCGSPLLARVGGRIVLSAREGTDLLAVESVDEGVRFGALRGLGRTD